MRENRRLARVTETLAVLMVLFLSCIIPTSSADAATYGSGGARVNLGRSWGWDGYQPRWSADVVTLEYGGTNLSTMASGNVTPKSVLVTIKGTVKGKARSTGEISVPPTIRSTALYVKLPSWVASIDPGTGRITVTVVARGKSNTRTNALKSLN